MKALRNECEEPTAGSLPTLAGQHQELAEGLHASAAEDAQAREERLEERRDRMAQLASVFIQLFEDARIARASVQHEERKAA
jgi:hypothetical protein